MYLHQAVSEDKSSANYLYCINQVIWVSYNSQQKWSWLTFSLSYKQQMYNSFKLETTQVLISIHDSWKNHSFD